MGEKSKQELLYEIDELQEQLSEAKETLHPIRTGKVDAFVVSDPHGEHVYTLKSADYTYRVLVERMNEGALILAQDGTIFYCNRRFAEMLKTPAEKLMGSSILQYMEPVEQDKIKGLLRLGESANLRTELPLNAADGTKIPVLLAVNSLPIDDSPGFCIVATDLAERKQTEETRRLLAAVQQEKERLSALIDSLTDEVWFADTRKQFTLVNPSAQRAFDLSSAGEIDVEELAASLEVHRPDGSPRPVEEAPALRALAGELVRKEEEIIRTPATGELRHRQVNATPVRDTDGVIIGSVCVVRDVTEGKRAEVMLRASEARFRLLSETAGRLLTTKDTQGIVNELCRQVMEHLDCHTFFNFLVDDQAGKLHLNVCGGIPEEEARKIEWLDYGVAVCGCAARDGVRIVAEDIFNTPDVRTELVKSYGIQAYACHPLVVGGRLIGTLSFGTRTRTRFSLQQLDVMRTVADQVATAMERLQLLEKLQRSRDELEIQVQKRTAELYTVNEALREEIRVRRNAEQAANMAKHSLQSVLDGLPTPLLMLDKHLSVGMLNAAARKYFKVADGEESVGKCCYEFAFGEGLPCARCGVLPAILEGEESTFEREGLFDPERIEQVTVYPLEEAVSGIPGAIVRISDITESKNIEKHLMQVDRLSSLGLVAGGIAHEIRNPLQGLSLFIDVLGDEEKFQRTALELNILQEMKTNIKRIDGIIRRVLDFSKQSVTASQKLKMSVLIEETIQLWRAKLQKSAITLRLSVGENLPPILGDPIEIRQVLTNLVQNAVESMATNGTLEIIAASGTLSLDKKRPAVIVKVRDSGVGIPLAQQKNIFNPFFSTKPTGTGLGLAISHRIILRHGGLLSFSSSPGVGTTFTFELPASQED